MSRNEKRILAAMALIFAATLVALGFSGYAAWPPSSGSTQIRTDGCAFDQRGFGSCYAAAKPDALLARPRDCNLLGPDGRLHC